MSSHRRGYPPSHPPSSRPSSSSWRQDDRRYDERRRKRHYSDDYRESQRRHDYGRSYDHHDHSSPSSSSGHGLHRSVWVGNLHNKDFSSRLLEDALISELRNEGLLYRGYKGSPIVRCDIREDKHDAYVEFRTSQDASNCVKLDRKRVARGPLHGLRLHVSPWRDVDYLIKMDSSKKSPSPSRKRPRSENEQRRLPSPPQNIATGQKDSVSGSDVSENQESSVWARMRNRPPTPPGRLHHKVTNEIPTTTKTQSTSRSSPSRINSRIPQVPRPSPISSNKGPTGTKQTSSQVSRSVATSSSIQNNQQHRSEGSSKTTQTKEIIVIDSSDDEDENEDNNAEQLKAPAPKHQKTTARKDTRVLAGRAMPRADGEEEEGETNKTQYSADPPKAKISRGDVRPGSANADVGNDRNGEPPSSLPTGKERSRHDDPNNNNDKNSTSTSNSGKYNDKEPPKAASSIASRNSESMMEPRKDSSAASPFSNTEEQLSPNGDADKSADGRTSQAHKSNLPLATTVQQTPPEESEQVELNDVVPTEYAQKRVGTLQRFNASSANNENPTSSALTDQAYLPVDDSLSQKRSAQISSEPVSQGTLEETEAFQRMKRDLLQMKEERDKAQEELGNIRYKNLLLNGRVGKLQEVQEECDQLKDEMETMRSNREIELGLGCRQAETGNSELERLKVSFRHTEQVLSAAKQQLSQAKMVARTAEDNKNRMELDYENISVELGNTRAQLNQANEQLHQYARNAAYYEKELANEQARHRDTIGRYGLQTQQFEQNQRELESLRQRLHALEAETAQEALRRRTEEAEQEASEQQEEKPAPEPIDEADFRWRLEEAGRRFNSVAEALSVATGELAVERQAKRAVERTLESERARRRAMEAEMLRLRALVATTNSGADETRVKAEVVEEPVVEEPRGRIV